MKSRFGLMVNDTSIRTPNVSLSDGDRLVLGAAASEAITIKQLPLSIAFDESLRNAGRALPLFPFDARIVEAVQFATHYVVPDRCETTVGICVAILSGIPLVRMSFLDEFLALRVPNAVNHTPVLLVNGVEQRYSSDIDLSALLAGQKFYAEDPKVSELLKALGANIHPAPSSETRSVKPEFLPHLYSSFLAADMTEFLSLTCPNITSARTVNMLDSEEDLFDHPDDVTLVDIDPPIDNDAREDRSMNQTDDAPLILLKEPAPATAPLRIDPLLPEYRDTEVKMVVSYVDLYRKNQSTDSAHRRATGVNFKNFRKHQPKRLATDCIGLADMRPYRSVMDTDTVASPGEQRGKREDWLEAGSRQTPTRQVTFAAGPVAAKNDANTGFKSSFFTDAMTFD